MLLPLPRPSNIFFKLVGEILIGKVFGGQCNRALFNRPKDIIATVEDQTTNDIVDCMECPNLLLLMKRVDVIKNNRKLWLVFKAIGKTAQRFESLDFFLNP